MDDFISKRPEKIPFELYSEYEDRPFHTCTRCGETLMDFDEGYHVAKIVKNGEAIFEYALCFSCHSGMISEFSSESQPACISFELNFIIFSFNLEKEFDYLVAFLPHLQAPWIVIQVAEVLTFSLCFLNYIK